MSYIIYADIESLIKTIDGCANNPENSSTTKIAEYIPCEYLISSMWPFNNIENKHTINCGESCMKKSSRSLREHATNTLNFEKKNVTVNKRIIKLHQDARNCYISHFWEKNLTKAH